MHMGYPMGSVPPASQFPPNPATLEAATEAVTKTLQGMTTNELYDLMAQTKLLIQRDPDQAKEILSSNPQLSYAFMQILLMLSLVRYEEVQVTSSAPYPSFPFFWKADSLFFLFYFGVPTFFFLERRFSNKNLPSQ